MGEAFRNDTRLLGATRLSPWLADGWFLVPLQRTGQPGLSVCLPTKRTAVLIVQVIETWLKIESLLLKADIRSAGGTEIMESVPCHSLNRPNDTSCFPSQNSAFSIYMRSIINNLVTYRWSWASRKRLINTSIVQKMNNFEHFCFVTKQLSCDSQLGTSLVSSVGCLKTLKRLKKLWWVMMKMNGRRPNHWGKR